MRVLRWIVERVDGAAAGELNAFGLTPRYGDLDWSGLDFDARPLRDGEQRRRRRVGRRARPPRRLFRQLAYHLPAELPAVRQRLAARLAG